jgi:hypothetical protein
MLSPRIKASIFATTLLLLGTSVSAQQQTGTSGSSGAQSGKPDATIDFSGHSVAAGIGYTWGHGVLHFQGKDYPFTANGISLVDVGASSVEASGSVYHLARIEDFPGNFTAVAAGGTVVRGGSAVVMANQHGVTIQAESTSQGLQLTLAPSGIAVALEGPPSMKGVSSQ